MVHFRFQVWIKIWLDCVDIPEPCIWFGLLLFYSNLIIIKYYWSLWLEEETLRTSDPEWHSAGASLWRLTPTPPPRENIAISPQNKPAEFLMSRLQMCVSENDHHISTQRPQHWSKDIIFAKTEAVSLLSYWILFKKKNPMGQNPSEFNLGKIYLAIYFFRFVFFLLISSL